MPIKLSTLLVAAMMFFAFSLFAQLLRSDLKFSLDLIPAQDQARTATCVPSSLCMAELNSLSWNLPPSLSA